MTGENTKLLAEMQLSLERGDKVSAVEVLEEALEEILQYYEVDPMLAQEYAEMCLDLNRNEELEEFFLRLDKDSELYNELISYYFQALLNQKKYLYLIEEIDWEQHSEYRLIQEEADSLLRVEEIEKVSKIKARLQKLEQADYQNHEMAMYLVQQCLDLRWDKRILLLPLLLQANAIPSIAKTQLLQDWYMFSTDETILMKWHGKDRKIHKKVLYLLQQHIFWLEGEQRIRDLMEDKDVILTDLLVQYFYSDLMSLYPFIDEHIESVEEWLTLTLTALELTQSLLLSEDEVLERLPKLMDKTR